jgi:anti-sigma-K factor RskA
MHTNPEDLALIALGESVGSPDERAHLAQCPVCRAELEELSRVVVAARQPDTEDALPEPSPLVWKKIQAEIASLRGTPTLSEPSLPQPSFSQPAQPEPSYSQPAFSQPAQPQPVQPLATSNSAGGSAGRRRLALALAAVFMLIAGLGVGFGVGRATKPAVSAGASAAVHLNALPAFPGAEGQAEVTKDAQGNRTLVVKVQVPTPVTGRLEVWLSDERALHMTSMGYLSADAGTFTIPAGLDLTSSPVIDVSVEPTNDPDPAHHSDVSLVRGRLVR